MIRSYFRFKRTAELSIEYSLEGDPYGDLGNQPLYLIFIILTLSLSLSLSLMIKGESLVFEQGGDAEISGMEFHKESTDTLRGGDSEEALRRMKDLTLNAISKYREIDQSEINMDKRPIGRGVFGIVYKGGKRRRQLM